MIKISEYLTTKISKSKIKATDNTIKQIVKEEMDKYGHNCDLNHVDVSEVTYMDSLFSCDHASLGKSYSDLNPDISGWNVSNVKKMHCMFWECKNFNSNISEWNVRNVTTMGYMFYKCENFNCNINKWNVSNVEDMNSMFWSCKSFNQPLDAWDVSKVKYMSCMFSGCKSFNQDLSMWDVSKVKYYDEFVFRNCSIEEKHKPHFKS